MPTVSEVSPSVAVAGIGLRGAHYVELAERRPAVGWLEIHAENYFGAGGPPLHFLERLRRDYPLSIHGVGLSLGSLDPLSTHHLIHLKRLVDRFEPMLVSEHLSWSRLDGRNYNDLIPLPHTEEALDHVVARIDRVQNLLGRPILVENVTRYLEYADQGMPEYEFLAETARRSGCGILLDITNLYLNGRNLGLDTAAYLEAIPAERVAEIHLAGFTRNRVDGGEMLIDSHNRRVAAPVWELYRRAVARLGGRPTLVEWDRDLPPLEVLLAEARFAQAVLDEARHADAA